MRARRSPRPVVRRRASSSSRPSSVASVPSASVRPSVNHRVRRPVGPSSRRVVVGASRRGRRPSRVRDASVATARRRRGALASTCARVARVRVAGVARARRAARRPATALDVDAYEGRVFRPGSPTRGLFSSSRRGTIGARPMMMMGSRRANDGRAIGEQRDASGRERARGAARSATAGAVRGSGGRWCTGGARRAGGGWRRRRARRTGSRAARTCGKILDERAAFSADATFVKNAQGASVPDGHYVPESGVAHGVIRATRGGRLYGAQVDSRERTLYRGKAGD